MKYCLYLLSVCMILSSCATLLNSPTTIVEVHTSQPCNIAYDNDTISCNNVVELEAERGPERLKFVVFTDSARRAITLRPQLSGTFIGGILFFNVLSLVEINNPIIYQYHKEVYINFADSTRSYTRFVPPAKGNTLVYLAVPAVNGFQFRGANDTTYLGSGIFGFSLGVDHYYQSNRFIRLYGSAAIDLAPGERTPERTPGRAEHLATVYLGLQHFHQLGRFSLGYGLSYGKNDLLSTITDSTNTKDTYRQKTVSAFNAGLLFSAYYQVTPRFNVGIIYRPDLLNFNNLVKLRYGHFMTLDMAWRFKARRTLPYQYY